MAAHVFIVSVVGKFYVDFELVENPGDHLIDHVV